MYSRPIHPTSLLVPGRIIHLLQQLRITLQQLAYRLDTALPGGVDEAQRHAFPGDLRPDQLAPPLLQEPAGHALAVHRALQLLREGVREAMVARMETVDLLAMSLTLYSKQET